MLRYKHELNIFKPRFGFLNMSEVTIKLPSLYQHCIEQNDAWVEKAKELATIKAHIKQLEAAEKQLTDQLEILSGGIPSKGGGYIFDLCFRKGNVQYKDIPQLKSVDLEQFRGDSVEYWKLTMEVK